MDNGLMTALLTFVTAAGGGLTVIVGKIWSIIRTEFKDVRREVEECRKEREDFRVEIATLKTASLYQAERTNSRSEVERILSNSPTSIPPN